LCLLVVASCSGQKSDFDRVKWLEGTWEGTSSGGNHFYETWTMAGDNMMIGRSYEVAKGDTVFGEQLRIEEREDGVFYVAKVSHNVDEVAFKLVQVDADRAVFTNPEHDFPQRFIYETYDNALYVRGELMDGGRKIEFQLMKVK
jgi:hypothetical protein